MCSSTRRSRHSPFAGHEPRHVREDIIRLVFQEVLAILLKLLPAAHFVFDADLPARHAVVGDLRIDVDEVRAQEAHFLQRVIADREDAVAEARGFHQRVLVVAALIAEDVFDDNAPRPSRVRMTL